MILNFEYIDSDPENLDLFVDGTDAIGINEFTKGSEMETQMEIIVQAAKRIFEIVSKTKT